MSATTITLDRLCIPKEHLPNNIWIPHTGPPGFLAGGADIPKDFDSHRVQVNTMAALPYQRASHLSNKSAIRSALHRNMEQILIGDHMPLWSLGLDTLPNIPEHRLIINLKLQQGRS